MPFALEQDIVDGRVKATAVRKVVLEVAVDRVARGVEQLAAAIEVTLAPVAAVMHRTSLGAVERTNAMRQAILPCSTVHAAVRIHHGAFGSVSQTMRPEAIVHVRRRLQQSTTMRLVVQEVADVELAIGIVQATESMALTLRELALVGAAVGRLQYSLTMRLSSTRDQ